jgi:hypothetical protein
MDAQKIQIRLEMWEVPRPKIPDSLGNSTVDLGGWMHKRSRFAWKYGRMPRPKVPDSLGNMGGCQSQVPDSLKNRGGCHAQKFLSTRISQTDPNLLSSRSYFSRQRSSHPHLSRILLISFH